MTYELRLALRSIWHSKLFALTALIAFSFGIGATTTVFSVIDAVLLRPATFPDSDSVVVVQSSVKHEDWDNVPPVAFDHLASHVGVFSDIAGSRLSLFTVTNVPVPDQVFGLSVSGHFFPMLGARPWRGRILLPEDDKPGAPPVALLSYRGWQKLFAADPNVVGKITEIDGNLYTVVGVMPFDFVLPGGSNAGCALWTTLRLTSDELAAPNARRVQVYARLRRSVTLARAQVSLNVLSSSLTSKPRHGREPIRLRALPWREEIDRSHRLILWLAMGMTAALLLIGCANLSSILLARAIAHRRDYAIRLATGGSRMQLIRQSLLEVCLLALAALFIACLGTSVALHLIRDHLSNVQLGIANITRVQLNTHTLLFSFAIAWVAALMCGLFRRFRQHP